MQYHNITCHYNVWWNGNESLKAGREKLYKGAVDDYTRLIPPENLGTEEIARTVNPEMDRAIEKSVKGIKKHSIFLKGEEHVPYIKECYLLSAYATFYKQDFVSTANTANILVTQFQGTRAGDEGAILLARCLIREKRYTEAEAALDQLAENLAKGNFTRSQRDKLYTAIVEATLPQEKYKKAVENIRLAIDASRSSRAKARLTFLLAQIYQQLDKRPVAAKYYHKVLSYSPEYVMEFNARLGEASCADLASLSPADIAKLERQLDNMLRDGKNEEYRDQIYYAKGEMYLGLKDAQRACDNYRLSVAVSRNNPACKARSAIRLGQVLYEQYENYPLAQIYYDTAMQIITSDYPHYQAIKNRHDILTELVSYTSVYTRNDSILALAALPEQQQLAIINAKIDTLIKHEQEQRERELLAEMAADAKAQQNTLAGDWYFYNANTVSKGKETFRQRWGLRPLEDLWFLSNKNTMLLPDDLSEEDDNISDTTSVDDSSAAVTETKSKYGNPDNPHDIAYYLKDLPTSQHQLDSLDTLTATALLGAAYIYQEGINNTPRALECYLRLARDYTHYDDIVQAFYMLYRIYDRQGNTPQANYYRDMVLRGFPDSDFANLIRDNEYYRQLIARDQRIEDDYQQVYELYNAHRNRQVITLTDQAEELYPANPKLFRFRLWRALATANLGDTPSAVKQLQDIVQSAPENDSIIPIAQAFLDLLNGSGTQLADAGSEDITPDDEQRVKQKQSAINKTEQINQKEEELPPEARIFRYRERQQYYVVIIVDDRRVQATELQYRLSDFNTQYYSNSGYKVNASLFTDTSQIITVHRFIDDQEALGYYKHLGSEESPLSKLNPKDYTLFFISTQNYATFYNRKNIDAYFAYFRKYHLKNK